MINYKLPAILLIEDDTIERMKFHRTIKKAGFENQVFETTNGEEALESLTKNQKLPDLIFLDLNMPRVNGLEFLKIIKANEQLRHIPCIVITTSNYDKDLLESYRLGIAGYIVKPLKYEVYEDHLIKVMNYWNINQIRNL